MFVGQLFYASLLHELSPKWNLPADVVFRVTSIGEGGAAQDNDVVQVERLDRGPLPHASFARYWFGPNNVFVPALQAGDKRKMIRALHGIAPGELVSVYEVGPAGGKEFASFRTDSPRVGWIVPSTDLLSASVPIPAKVEEQQQEAGAAPAPAAAVEQTHAKLFGKHVKLPGWAAYATVDSYGLLYVWNLRPIHTVDRWVGEQPGTIALRLCSVRHLHGDWRNSMTPLKEPVKQPADARTDPAQHLAILEQMVSTLQDAGTKLIAERDEARTGVNVLNRINEGLRQQLHAQKSVQAERHERLRAEHRAEIDRLTDKLHQQEVERDQLADQLRRREELLTSLGYILTSNDKRIGWANLLTAATGLREELSLAKQMVSAYADADAVAGQAINRAQRKEAPQGGEPSESAGFAVIGTVSVPEVFTF